MNTCRSCGAAVRWGVTRLGKRMPLDAEPSPKGNCAIAPDGTITVYGTGDAQTAREAGTALHTPHHSTCHQGATWRRS